METYIIGLLLSLSYIIFYVILQTLSDIFEIKDILISAYILAGIIMILFVNKEIKSLIKKYNTYNIFLILILVLSMIFSNFLLTFVCNSYINFGLVESISMSIYLPSAALISYFYYKKIIL